MSVRGGFWTASLVAAALSVTACASQTPSTSVRQVVSTTSFGMCAGYCSTRLEISEGQAVLVRNGRGRGVPDLPEQRIRAPLTPAEWSEISALAAKTNLGALPETIGCPDCADGGAESIAIATSADAPRTVTFDFNASIEQAQPLLDRVRTLRQRLTPHDGDTPTH
ncbi:MAG: hypothetical protein QM759_05670 [Terricaulis sp.]